MHTSEGGFEPTGDYSKWTPLSIGLLLVALAGVALLVMADLSTLVEIKIGDVTEQQLKGGDQHGWAMLVLGVAALPLAVGATRGRARPAQAGLALLGLVAVVIALASDLPDTRSEGVFGERYESAHASPGPGFYFEVAGAALLLVAGGASLALLPPRPEKPATRRASSAGLSSDTNV
jgi:hypothetical protein